MSDAPKTPTQPGGYEGRIGRYGSSLAQAFLAATGVRSGQRVLDVGCGTGALTAQLADVVGPELVAGIDPAAADVAACADRLPGADIRTGEAERLPFADASFDVVLSQLVVGHLRDADAAVREMARVARPGAPVAGCVWDFEEGMTVLRAFWDAAATVDAAGAARFDQARTHPYSTPEGLQLLWEAAGLADVGTGELMATAGYESFEDLWQPLLVPDGAPGRFLATLPTAGRDAVRELLLERIGRPTGAFELSARAWFVEGRMVGVGSAGDEGRDRLFALPEPRGASAPAVRGWRPDRPAARPACAATASRAGAPAPPLLTCQRQIARRRQRAVERVAALAALELLDPRLRPSDHAQHRIDALSMKPLCLFPPHERRFHAPGSGRVPPYNPDTT